MERIRQRGLPINPIRECVSKPDKVLRSDNVKRAVKKLDSRALVVVYRALDDEALIITAYATSKVSKYL